MADKRFTVGDKVLWVYKGSTYNVKNRQYEPKTETRWLTVTAVGRKWVTTEGGPLWCDRKFDVATGKGDDQSIGRIFKDAEEQQRFEEAELAAAKAERDWLAFRRYVGRYYNLACPVSSDALRRMGADLGMAEDDWDNR